MATTTISRRHADIDSTTTHKASFMDRVMATTDSLPLLVARVGLGVVILPHGLQKVFGLFGGTGFSATMEYFRGQGIPSLLVVLVMMAEFLGSLGLIFGFISRIGAFGVFCVMLGATLLVHLPNGFFMNWDGTQRGEGFEFHILAMALAIAVMVGGAGRFSIDLSMWRKRQRPVTTY